MQEINAIIRLGAALEDQRNKALDLWTWLPSCKAAKDAHGDYYAEYMPSVADIIVEATLFIGHGLAPNDEQRASAGDYYHCPCGEDHINGAEQLEA